MSRASRHGVPWMLWPFAALWDFLAFLLGLVGRLMAAVLGLGLMVVGFLLTISVVGAVLGIPLMVFGFLLAVRSLF